MARVDASEQSTGLSGVEQVAITVDGQAIEVPTDSGLSDQPVGRGDRSVAPRADERCCSAPSTRTVERASPSDQAPIEQWRRHMPSARRTTASAHRTSAAAGTTLDGTHPAGALHVVVGVLAVWLFVSPFLLGYPATGAANDVVLAQAGAGIVLGVTALPMVRHPAGHPRLALLALAAALLLLAAPRLLGAADGTPPPDWAGNRYVEAAGAVRGTNTYAPVATTNVTITAVLVLALLCTSLVWTGRSTRSSRQ